MIEGLLQELEEKFKNEEVTYVSNRQEFPTSYSEVKEQDYPLYTNVKSFLFILDSLLDRFAKGVSFVE